MAPQNGPRSNKNFEKNKYTIQEDSGGREWCWQVQRKFGEHKCTF